MLPKVGQKTGIPTMLFFPHKNKTFVYITMIFQPLTFMWWPPLKSENTCLSSTLKMVVTVFCIRLERIYRTRHHIPGRRYSLQP